ncbi:MAG TPA: VanW family protein [Vitreimonas sp.]|nr:VanW family protein [Vitreimonas sp.]
MTAKADTAPRSRAARRTGARFAGAFLAGVLAVLALGTGALYAYDREYEGRILPGVRVGSVDLSGLAPADARSRLSAAYGELDDGELVLVGGGRTTAVSYADLGRRLDVDALVDAAVTTGRTGEGLERVMSGARTALRGITLEPRVVFDMEALAGRIEDAAARLDREPKDAGVGVSAEGITVTWGEDGTVADRQAPLAAAAAALAQVDVPDRLEVAIPISRVEPWITTAEAQAGKAAGERIARDVDIVAAGEAYTIKASTIRTWLRITPTVDGRVAPVLNVTAPTDTIEEIAEAVRQSPRNASFVIGDNNKVTGVNPSREGRTLDVPATTKLLTDTLRARVGDEPAPAVEAAVTITKPALTTEEAERAAPLMTRISTWTTYFPISEKNGLGANIWIPAEDIDGYVVGPGEWFDFWKATGPVTRERGYRDGGAIINGKTEPQGALAGGICSTSTTLFNAALRAGFQMGDRRNHYYYIDRYPLGLDATVFKSSSGSVQTMSWRNDTKYPVLVRGFRIKDGNAGYVRFDLYSVPNGRTVSFSNPTVKNVKPATDTIQETSTLPAGERKRIEYPVEGKDVWVTRTVRDANGNVVHRETYFSRYAVITGITLVGTG